MSNILLNRHLSSIAAAQSSILIQFLRKFLVRSFQTWFYVFFRTIEKENSLLNSF